MQHHSATTARVICILATLAAMLATVQFTAGASPAGGITLVAIALALLVLGGYEVGRSRQP